MFSEGYDMFSEGYDVFLEVYDMFLGGHTMFLGGYDMFSVSRMLGQIADIQYLSLYLSHLQALISVTFLLK